MCDVVCRDGYRPCVVTKDVDIDFAFNAYPFLVEDEHLCMTDAQRAEINAASPGAVVVEEGC